MFHIYMKQSRGQLKPGEQRRIAQLNKLCVRDRKGSKKLGFSCSLYKLSYNHPYFNPPLALPLAEL